MAVHRRALIVLGSILAGVAARSPAQQGAVAFGGASATFTAEQSTRGKAVFAANCASCHGPEGTGGQFGPTLRGAAFHAQWSPQPATALAAYIRANMPPGQAGTLSNAEYAAATAAILEWNGARPGAVEFGGGAPPSAGAAATPAAPETVRRSRFAPSEPNHDATFDAETARKAAMLARVSPVTDAMLRAPADGDWLMWRRGYSGLGFSPLDQINARTVADLRLAWSWTLGPSLNEITPLEHDGVLFIHSGATVQALDATTGDLLWQYVRTLPDSLRGGRSGRSKSMAIYGNAVFLPMVDGHFIALDARTGKLLWDHEVLSAKEVADGVQLNGAPIVVNGKVMMGTSLSLTLKGGCYIFALDTNTGAEAWRFHTIAQPGEIGGDSWNGVPGNQRFGGSQWTGGSYDPERNLVYFGVGNTYDTSTLLQAGDGPQPRNSGLFTESTIALDPDTGKLGWHYQHMTRDLWDMDWVFEQSLIDMPVNGTTRKLVVTGGKMALFDAVDRTNGRYVLSRDAGLQNIVVAIDPKTGAKTYNPAFKPVSGEQKLLCPGSSGFRSWMSTSYDPTTHILYVPMFENCGNFTWTKRDPTANAGGIDQAFQTRKMPNSDGNFGRIQAMNLQTGKTVWLKRQRAPLSSSMLATAGGIVFAGSGDRYFRAYDKATGDVRWETRLGSTASSSPITYSVNGVQYLAVVTGGGNPQDSGWAPLAPEISNASGNPVLSIFRLPANVPERKAM